MIFVSSPLNVRTTLVAGTSVVRGLFIEMFLTTILMLTVLVLTVEESAIGAKSAGASAAPISIGLALFLAELVGVFYTGGCELACPCVVPSLRVLIGIGHSPALNPARSIGPDIVIGTFDFYHWIYWVCSSVRSPFREGRSSPSFHPPFFSRTTARSSDGSSVGGCLLEGYSIRSFLFGT